MKLTKILSIKYKNKEQKAQAEQHFKLFESNPQCSVRDLPDFKKILLDTQERMIYVHGAEATVNDYVEALEKEV